MYACTDFDYSSPESAQSAKRNVVKGLGSEVDEETKSDLNSILLLILELGLPKKKWRLGCFLSLMFVSLCSLAVFTIPHG